MAVLRIKWIKGPSNGFTDIIPTSLFENNLKQDMEHAVLGSNNDIFFVPFSKITGHNEIIFDYGGLYRDDNLSSNFIPGAYRFRFEDDKRDGVPNIEWRDEISEFATPPIIAYFDDDFSALEGGTKLAAHLVRERSRKLRTEKLGQTHDIRCEACSEKFEDRYGREGRKIYEVHHTKPLKNGAGETTLNDLAILCPNCHRMIHQIEPMPTFTNFENAITHKEARHPEGRRAYRSTTNGGRTSS